MMADTEAVINIRANTTQFRKAMTGVSASMYAAGGAASRFGTIARGVLTPLTAALTATALSAKAMATVVQRSSVLFIEFNDTLAEQEPSLVPMQRAWPLWKLRFGRSVQRPDSLRHR